jgi:hypothetical protein
MHYFERRVKRAEATGEFIEEELGYDRELLAICQKSFQLAVYPSTVPHDRAQADVSVLKRYRQLGRKGAPHFISVAEDRFPPGLRTEMLVPENEDHETMEDGHVMFIFMTKVPGRW